MQTERRKVLKAGAALALTSMSSVLTGCATKPSDQVSFVLIPPPFMGAWIWERVSPYLHAAGYRSYPLTLKGVAERKGEFANSINLDTHVEEILATIETNNLQQVVLVGASLSGILVSLAADRAPHRLRKLVYVDALILESGQSVRSSLPPQGQVAFKSRESEIGGVRGLTPLPASAIGIQNKEDQQWVDGRTTLHPLGVYDQPMLLRHSLGNGVPKVFIDCTNPVQAAINSSRAKARSQPGWHLEPLATGHTPMVTAPRQLAEILLRHATS